MKKVILLFALLLPVSAFGDSKKFYEAAVRIDEKADLLLVFSEQTSLVPARSTRCLNAALALKLESEKLGMLSFHASTMEKHGIKSDDGYKKAWASVEESLTRSRGIVLKAAAQEDNETLAAIILKASQPLSKALILLRGNLPSF